MTGLFALILFVTFGSGATASVKVNFDGQIACVMAAKTLEQETRVVTPDAKVIWACVSQS